MRKVRYFSLLIFLSLLAIAGGVILFSHERPAQAGGEHNLTGWAWEENMGWISFNCTNQGSCADANYGVAVDSAGDLSGYAWSEHAGWISFDIEDTGNCPTAPCQAHLDRVSGQVSGWAKVLAGGTTQAGGWEGWIALRGSNYGVEVKGCSWTGWAWDDLNQGWIHFRDMAYIVSGRGTACEASPIPNPTATLSVTPEAIVQGESVTIEWASTGADTCTGTNFDTNGDIEGSTTDTPVTNTLYVVVCENALGDFAQAMAEVRVYSEATTEVSLSASPSQGNAPLPVTLTADVTTTESDPINYGFWWDCEDPTTDVAEAENLCGVLPTPAAGSCESNGDGVWCEAMSNTNQQVSHTYDLDGSYVAKVIVTQGENALPSQDQATILVGSQLGGPLQIGSCSGSPAVAQQNDPVEWRAENITGGDGVYDFEWDGSAPLDDSFYDGIGKNPVTVPSYGSPARSVSGSVRVSSGAESDNASCGTVRITGTSMSFSASPSFINPGQSSTLSWTTSGFTSCSIDQGVGRASPTSGGDRTVSPTTNTTYTLTCSGAEGTFTRSATVRVRGQPRIEEVKPE